MCDASRGEPLTTPSPEDASDAFRRGVAAPPGGVALRRPEAHSKLPLARVLLLADTHIGFDLPQRPRIQRRRRGHDFVEGFERALEPALQGKVDLVVHGGDLFDRSKVRAGMVSMGMAPLARVAEAGVPVFVVPGNHERARIPLHLWTAHPGIHIFDRPRTFLCPLEGGVLGLSGFPFARRVRDSFDELVRATGYDQVEAGARVVCMHQTVEGAQVGPSDFTFRKGSDVVRGKDLPRSFAAVLSGHIHRAQVLTHDLSGRTLAAPVIYPGSVERTSFAERHEQKAYVVASVALAGPRQGRVVDVARHPLPARPMVAVRLVPGKPEREALVGQVRCCLADLDPNTVVRLRVEGPYRQEALAFLSAPVLRELAPPTMNVSLAPGRFRPGQRSGAFAGG